MTGREFRAALEALGVTQRWFADALGVGARQVNRWASGAVPVPRYALLVLALLDHSAGARAVIAETRLGG